MKALLGSARQILTQHLSESQWPRLLQGDCHTELRRVLSATCSEPSVSACCFVLLMMVERKVIVILIFIIIRD